MKNAVRLGEISVRCTGTYREKNIEKANVAFYHSSGMVEITVRLYFSEDGISEYRFHDELLASYEEAKEIQKDINSFLREFMTETAIYK